MTTKYVARLNGTIVGKRTTKDRTYTHAIVVQWSEENARKRAYEYRATEQDRRHFDYFTQIVEQGIEHEHVRVDKWRKEPDLKVLEGAKANIEGGLDGFVARIKARMIEGFERSLAKGGFDPCVAGWAGRLDLAQKAVASHTGPDCKLVAIVPAEVAA